MAVVHNLKRVAKSMERLAKTHPLSQDVSVIVGYTANYALQVHERTDIPHQNGEAKFLEKPAREKEKDVANTVVKGTKASGSLEKGLILGGLLLQRESQQLVPVDTGNLKGSAFTKAEK